MTHSLTFVTAARAIVGLLAETTYNHSLIHIPINLKGLKITRYAHFVKRRVDCCQDSKIFAHRSLPVTADKAKKVDKRAGNKVVADKNIELLCKELF